MSTNSAPIDLTTALPPSPPEFDEELRDTLATFSRQEQFGLAMRQNRPGGSIRDREAAVRWLAPRLGEELSVERVIVTNGTQSALMLILHALVGAGGVLAAEALTYVVLRTIAQRLGVTVVGVALDEEGIDPEAFEEICRTRKPKALYCNPTVHNPTAAVMSERRRAQIIEIARRYQVTIIEDDVLGAVHPEAPRPFSALAPEITWYVMSLSKCYAMGLRIAYLVAPSAEAQRQLVEPVHRLSSWFPSSLCVEVVSRWAFSNAGRRVAQAVRDEAIARQEIAGRILDGAHVRTAPGALHLWLSLPPQWSPNDFAAAARDRGVLVRPANLFAIDAAAVCDHVRVSLTGPASREDLRRGLTLLASLRVDHDAR